MKAAISLLLFAVVLFSAGAVTPPAFDWQKPGSASDAQFRQFQSDGSIAKRPLPVVQDETLRKPVIVLDGGRVLYEILFRSDLFAARSSYDSAVHQRGGDGRY